MKNCERVPSRVVSLDVHAPPSPSLILSPPPVHVSFPLPRVRVSAAASHVTGHRGRVGEGKKGRERKDQEEKRQKEKEEKRKEGEKKAPKREKQREVFDPDLYLPVLINDPCVPLSGPTSINHHTSIIIITGTITIAITIITGRFLSGQGLEAPSVAPKRLGSTTRHEII